MPKELIKYKSRIINLLRCIGTAIDSHCAYNEKFIPQPFYTRRSHSYTGLSKLTLNLYSKNKTKPKKGIFWNLDQIKIHQTILLILLQTQELCNPN